MKNYSFASTSSNGHRLVAAINLIVAEETEHAYVWNGFAVASVQIWLLFLIEFCRDFESVFVKTPPVHDDSWQPATVARNEWMVRRPFKSSLISGLCFASIWQRVKIIMICLSIQQKRFEKSYAFTNVTN